MSTEPKTDVEIAANELSALYESQAEMAELIQEIRVESGLNERIEAEQIRIENATKMQNTLYEAFEEQYAHEHEAMRRLDAEVRKAESSLKRACHNMPIDAIRKGFRADIGRVSIKINRPTLNRVFDTEAILHRYPNLEQQRIDGDPIVVRTLSAGLLDRLVAAGSVDREFIEEHTTEVLAKNPSTSINKAG